MDLGAFVGVERVSALAERIGEDGVLVLELMQLPLLSGSDAQAHAPPQEIADLIRNRLPNGVHEPFLNDTRTSRRGRRMTEWRRSNSHNPPFAFENRMYSQRYAHDTVSG